MGKREQAGKSHSYPSHCTPCLKERRREKETKTDISIEKKQPFLICGRKYRATQMQVSKFFIDDNLPNFDLN